MKRIESSKQYDMMTKSEKKIFNKSIKLDNVVVHIKLHYALKLYNFLIKF